MQLSDANLETVERLINEAIHEAVFAKHHARDDSGDDALTRLVQVQSNCEEAANIILVAMKEAGET